MPLPSAQADRLTPSEVDAALRGLSVADWTRARNLASLCASGLTGWSADDLLQETLTKLLSGDRVWRPNLHPLVVLKTAMNGIASNIRKKDDEGPIDLDRSVATLDEKDEEGNSAFARPVNAVTPEDTLYGQRSLAAIQKAVADNDDMGLVVMAWADGLRGKEAAAEVGFEMNKYEAVRKQLTRRLAPLVAAKG